MMMTMATMGMLAFSPSLRIHSGVMQQPLSCVRCAETAAPVAIGRFLRDLEFLGPVRFVVQGPGAILEAVGSFENLRIKEIPGKGPLATVSDEDNAFECHVRCGEVKTAQFVSKETGASQ